MSGIVRGLVSQPQNIWLRLTWLAVWVPSALYHTACAHNYNRRYGSCGQPARQGGNLVKHFYSQRSVINWKTNNSLTFQVVFNLLMWLTISLDSGWRWGLARLTDKLAANRRKAACHILPERQVNKFGLAVVIYSVTASCHKHRLHFSNWLNEPFDFPDQWRDYNIST